MPTWLDALSHIFKNKVPLSELLPQMLDPGDPRIVIRPLGDDWLCPYTAQRIMVPAWDGSSLTLLQQFAVVQHLQSLPELEYKGKKARMKEWGDLVQWTILMRLREGPNYKITSEKGEWVCPHCCTNTGTLLHEWDGSPAPLSWFVPEALKHLRACQAYIDDPLGAKSVLEMKSLHGEGAVRVELSHRIATDPIFRISDGTGAWICPFSERPIPHINLFKHKWGSTVQEQIIEYVLSPECPARYNNWQTHRTVADLNRIVERLDANRAHVQSKNAAEREMRILRENIDLLKREAKNVHIIKKDLEEAKTAQLKMLPDKPPEIQGYDVATFYQPSDELGGDFYHFLHAGIGHTGFLIGDVSGHGVQAAVIMSMALKSFGVRSAGVASPAQVLASVNGDLLRDLQRGRFVSAFYAILEHESGILRCARAGQPPSLLVDPRRGTVDHLAGDGLVLGVGENKPFVKAIREYEVGIPPGGLLLMYTDGITEAMNQQEEEYGIERLQEVVVNCSACSADLLLDYIVAGVREHIGGAPLSDDMTVIALKRL